MDKKNVNCEIAMDFKVKSDPEKKKERIARVDKAILSDSPDINDKDNFSLSEYYKKKGWKF